MTPMIVLSEDEGGKVVIDSEDLLKTVSELFPNHLNKIPTQFHNMPFIAWIKYDVASGNDRLGYGKYKKVLKDRGFDV